MKTFFLVAFGLIAFVSTAIPLPSVNDYKHSTDLLSYLKIYRSYYYPKNSLFFQFDWYIEWDQAQQIITIMDNIIYSKYGLNGIFLVLSDEAKISSLDDYTTSFLLLLEANGIYSRTNTYAIVLYYTVGQIGTTWEYQMSIRTGGEKASRYLSY